MDSVGQLSGKIGWRAAILRSLRVLLPHPSLPLVAAGLGVLLALPSLWGGWVTDDRNHVLALAHGSLARDLGLANSAEPTGLFTFFSGDPATTHRLMDVGVAPWWTYDRIRAAFFRPVAWFTHWVDCRLWSDSPALMHAQSILWLAVLLVAVSLLYRAVMGPTIVAGLAALLFAIDETHVIPIGWLANRNALLAAVFGVLALVSHDRWVRCRWRGGVFFGPFLLVLSLLSSEGGVGALAYLGAYAFFLDRSAWRRRILTLLPYAVVVLVWRLVWQSMNYGADGGGGVYVDPLGEPLRFAEAFLERAPVLILAQFAWPPADLAAFVGWRVVFLVAAGVVLSLSLLVVVVIPLVRRDVAARFWAVGAGLSLVPACASFPSDRSLMFVGLGAMGLVAQFLTVTYRRIDRDRACDQAIAPSPIPSPSIQGTLRFLRRPLAGLFVLMHLVVSPIALAIRAQSPLGGQHITEQLHVNLPPDAPLDQRDVLVITAPSVFHVGYLPIRRALAGLSVPRHTRNLSPSHSAVSVHRLDLRTLLIRPEDGYLGLMYDRLYRSEDYPMHVGQRVELTGMTVEVKSLTDDGRPAEVLFHFDRPLEDPSMLWLKWKDGRFVSFTPPGVGETVNLPAPIPSFF